jgi:hypothetical protein
MISMYNKLGNKKEPIHYDFNDILKNLCYSSKDGVIFLNYEYFKLIAIIENYDYIIQYLVKIIENVLLDVSEFTMHVSMKGLTLSDLDKYYGFISKISIILKEKFPEKLNSCFIHNSPFIFSQLYKIVSAFIDKSTQKKIKMV